MVATRAHELFQHINAEGEAALDHFITQGYSEELFLDFKRVTKDGAGRALEPADRHNYAKAISGFGNSEGGVIVWGIDCRKNAQGADLPTDKFPIEDPRRFRSWLEGATSGLTIPPHGGVQHHAIVREDGRTGFVASLIPKSSYPPHQTVTDQRYLMRAGASFLPVPHAILAGMFGRRPQPEITHEWDVEHLFIKPSGELHCRANLTLVNTGIGMGEHMFVNLRKRFLPGDNCAADFVPPSHGEKAWTYSLHQRTIFGAMSVHGVRMPPMARRTPIQLFMTLRPPFGQALLIDGECGCDGAHTAPILLEAQSETVTAVFHELSRVGQFEKASPYQCRMFADAVFAPTHRG